MSPLARVSISLVLFATSAGAFGATPQYTMTLLGAGYATAINSAGVVAGAGKTDDGYYHAALFQSVSTDLGTLNGASAFSYATGVNNRGQAVGWTDTTDEKSSFVYSDGTMTRFDGANFHPGVANGINDRGQIVGGARFGDLAGAQHAFSYHNGVATDLGTLGADYSVANGVNQTGLVVGTLSTYKQQGWGVSERGFVYENGTMSALRILGSDLSVANAVNASGSIVGKFTSANAEEHAYIYSDGSATDLGTIGGVFSEAIGMNDAGSVVGVASTGDTGQLHAFIFQDQQMNDLNTLVLENYGFTLRSAYGINQRGQIAAYGCNLMDCQAILLDPLAVPEPGSYAMLFSGLGIIALVRRRRAPRHLRRGAAD